MDRAQILAVAEFGHSTGRRRSKCAAQEPVGLPPIGASALLTSGLALSISVCLCTKTISIRRPSVSTTSNRQPHDTK
jgi:hypothetical protein